MSSKVVGRRDLRLKMLQNINKGMFVDDDLKRALVRSFLTNS